MPQAISGLGPVESGLKLWDTGGLAQSSQKEGSCQWVGFPCLYLP